MNERISLSKNSIVIDTGVFIEYFEKTEAGIKFKKKLLMDPDIIHYHLSPLVETELKYLFCRKWGKQKGFLLVEELLMNYSIHSESDLRDEASRLKCNYSISLADCYSLAIATLNTFPIYFKKEAEILENLKSLSKEAELLFIEDI